MATPSWRRRKKLRHQGNVAHYGVACDIAPACAAQKGFQNKRILWLAYYSNERREAAPVPAPIAQKASSWKANHLFIVIKLECRNKRITNIEGGAAVAGDKARARKLRAGR